MTIRVADNPRLYFLNALLQWRVFLHHRLKRFTEAGLELLAQPQRDRPLNLIAAFRKIFRFGSIGLLGV